MKRIMIIGLGGQGIAFCGWLIGYTATRHGLYASIHTTYGAEVRGGLVESKIVIDDRPITNPYIEEYDLRLILHSHAWRAIEKIGEDETIIADDTLAKENSPENIDIDWRPFDKISHENNLPINMIALGYLSKLGVIPIDKLIEGVKEVGRDVERNIEAIEHGYRL
jgi:Pyruvate/2-oxoacid:ferredoxin oxidoreductase gamma subunit